MPKGKRPLLKSKLLNFYYDDKLDVKAEAILKALPSGQNSTTFIKQAICFYYDEAQRNKNKEDQPVLPNDITEIISNVIKETIRDELKENLPKMVIETPNESNSDTNNKEIPIEKTNEEIDVPDDVLGFLNNL